jgi:hypothetical protein
MTEKEWLDCEDPTPMLEFLRGKVSDRKMRLFAVACCRRIWHLLTDERSRLAVNAVEQFADELASQDEILRAEALASAVETALVHAAKLGDDADDWAWDILLDGCAAANAVQTCFASDYWSGKYTVYWFAQQAVAHAESPLRYEMGHRKDTPGRARARAAEGIAQSRIIRDIFCNPFRPVTVEASWLTSDVLTLAEGIYQDRAFDRMPILADALQDAGCDNDEMLNHCRQPGEHVRGCWAVDLLLGNE